MARCGWWGAPLHLCSLDAERELALHRLASLFASAQRSVPALSALPAQQDNTARTALHPTAAQHVSKAEPAAAAAAGRAGAPTGLYTAAGLVSEKDLRRQLGGRNVRVAATAGQATPHQPHHAMPRHAAPTTPCQPLVWPVCCGTCRWRRWGGRPRSGGGRSAAWCCRSVRERARVGVCVWGRVRRARGGCQSAVSRSGTSSRAASSRGARVLCAAVHAARPCAPAANVSAPNVSTSTKFSNSQ